MNAPRGGWLGAAAALAVAARTADGGPAPGLEAQLRATVVPVLEARDAPVADVLARAAAAAGPAAPNLVFQPAAGADGGAGGPRLTLNLRRISLYDALRYVCELSGLQFRIDERAVVVFPAGAPSGPVVTRMYPVQPAAVDALREAGYPVTESGARARPQGPTGLRGPQDFR